jgi:hypothetical protein
MKYIILTLLAAMLYLPNLSAQSAQQAAPAFDPSVNTLRDQYKNLKSDLDVINGFRMVKLYTMDKFWNVVEDSLRTQRTKFRESTAIVANQKTEIASLNTTIQKLEGEKEVLSTKVDNMIVFGMAFSKGGVVTTASVIVLVLVAVSVALFVISRSAYNTSRELRKLNESMYQEFDTYKRHAVEKEIKISRELQNHRNKLAELKIA